MTRIIRSVALGLLIGVAPIAGCDCGGTTGGRPCTSASDCRPGQVCRDMRCMDPTSLADGALPDGRSDGAGPDGGSRCPSMVLCGTPPACCASGEECVADRCLPACASGVRCGADRMTCCAADQVCVSAVCVDPGDACVDSFDCPEGAFCEPTLGRCLPQMEPVSCETEPVFGAFETIVEWSAETAVEAPDCMHPISAPVVVDLDGDAVPEVLINAACDDDWRRGVLRAYHGDTGAPAWSVIDAAHQLNGRSGIAAGDLDGDGRPEVIALSRPDGASQSLVFAFGPDGAPLWTATDPAGAPLRVSFDNGAPTLADLDQDGTPEVILGAVVLEATGRLRWQRDAGGAEGTNNGYTGGITVVADIDMDDLPEVVTGHRAYEHDGTAKWTAAVADGYPAIAQLDMDPQPEVVLVASGNVYILDGLTGAVGWGPIALPGGGRGGPPTVADFDGDGLPEIGVAGAGSYSVYDPDGPMPVLWSHPTQDISSNATGSSVFDFEGDGVAEVVYGDECYMRVYRGSDGMVLLQIPSTSATIHEYPLVADADADGNSEIVIVANDRADSIRTQCRAADPTWDGARRGLFIYGDARDQWVRTRRVWNQHAYHVTNVTPAGVIPMMEIDNWSVPGLNNYRQNAQGEGVFNAPDLVVLALEVRLDGCPTSVTLRARIGNEGSLGVAAGVPVSFYRGRPDMLGEHLGVVPTAVDLLPGATTVVELEVMLVGDPPYPFTAVVDDDGTGVGIVEECHEDNNTASVADVDCDIVF